MVQIITSLGSQFGLAVAGGVCGAVLNNLTMVIRDWVTKTDNGKLAALHIALTLEQYASDCLDPIQDLENFGSPQGSGREPSGRIPNLAEYPPGVDWRSFGIRSTCAAFEFRVSVQHAQACSYNVWTYDGVHAAWGYAATKSAELGKTALIVARRLRSEFGLPASRKHDDFDIEGFFRNEIAKTEAHKAANRSLLKELN